MRRVLFISLFLTAVPVFAELPAKDNTPAGRTAWELYSQVMLIRLFPEHAAALANRPVVVVDSPIPNAKRTGNFYVFNFELIMTAEDEEEYAAILAHEFSHRWRGHLDTMRRDYFVELGDDMELLEKQELEADADSLVTLRRAGMDPCAAVRELDHIIDGYDMRARPDRPYFAFFLRREAALITGCAVH